MSVGSDPPAQSQENQATRRAGEPAGGSAATEPEPTVARHETAGHRAALSPHALSAAVVEGIGFAAFTWFVVWQGTAGQPLVWADSHGYEHVAASPLWSFGFWEGSRPPAVPLLWKMTGSPSWFVLVQSFVFAAGWCVLAWSVGQLVPRGWRRALASLAVVGFASSTPLVLWNRSVLSESMALTAAALLLAALLRLSLGYSRLRLLAVTAAAALCVGSRDAQAATTGALAVALVAVVAVRLLRRRPWWRPGAVAAGLVLVTWASVYSSTTSQRTTSDLADVFEVRIFPYPDRVQWFADHGLPDVAIIDAAARLTPAPPGQAKVVQVTTPAVVAWIDSSGRDAYLLWLVTHPWYVVDEPLVRPERAFNFAGGSITFYAAAGRTDSPLSAVLWPGWIWLLPIGAAGALGALATGPQRRRPLLAAAGVAAAGMATMLVAWHSDGQEVTRHTIEGLAELRLGLLVLLVVSVLSLTPGDLRRVAAGRLGSKLRRRHPVASATASARRAAPVDAPEPGQ